MPSVSSPPGPTRDSAVANLKPSAGSNSSATCPERYATRRLLDRTLCLEYWGDPEKGSRPVVWLHDGFKLVCLGRLIARSGRYWDAFLPNGSQLKTRVDIREALCQMIVTPLE